MKVYIAGPITTDPKYREKFMNAEVKMKQCGYKVVNPAKNKCESYEEYIDTGLRQLMECDTIYLLKGWETSRGASLEAHYAEVKGLRIFEQ